MNKLLFPHIFPHEPPIRLVTGDFSKLAAFTPPEISAFLKDFKPEEGMSYLHLNALGSGEVWGANVNGDYFPERALMHKGASHGYKTFELHAHVFRHHVNKDPARAMGRVKVAAYNPVMHRVELIAEIDNEKGETLLKKVAAGEYPDWSMGCKVPFDVCSICGHQSKKVTEYCDHLKYAMNKIAEDGRRHYAINTLPKFFDISEVLVGADKTAKLLKKVASAKDGGYSSAFLGLCVYGEDEEKTASPKVAEMDKAIPGEPSATPALERTVRSLRSAEPPLNKKVVLKLAAFELPEILSTLSFSGIVLKPSEFQEIILRKAGQAKLAESLEKRGVVFPELCDDDVDGLEFSADTTIHPDHVKLAVLQVIQPYVPFRSIFEAHVHNRIGRMQVLGAKTASPAPAVKTAGLGEMVPLLGALGLAYLLYRRGLPLESKAFEELLIKKPWMAPVVLGGAVGGVDVIKAIAGPSPQSRAADQLHQAYLKVGSAWKTLGTVLGPIGLAYLTAASAARKQYRGEELTGFERLMKDYPAPLGILGVYGLVKARQALAQKPAQTAFQALRAAVKK